MIIICFKRVFSIIDSFNKFLSKKNLNFGTLTSIYWIWKNELKNYKNDQWIGICHYRRFWLKENHEKRINFNNLRNNLLKNFCSIYCYILFIFFSMILH